MKKREVFSSALLIGIGFVLLAIAFMLPNPEVILQVTKTGENYTLKTGDATYSNLTDLQVDSIMIYDLQIGENIYNDLQTHVMHCRYEGRECPLFTGDDQYHWLNPSK